MPKVDDEIEEKEDEISKEIADIMRGNTINESAGTAFDPTSEPVVPDDVLNDEDIVKEDAELAEEEGGDSDEF